MSNTNNAWSWGCISKNDVLYIASVAKRYLGKSF